MESFPAMSVQGFTNPFSCHQEREAHCTSEPSPCSGSQLLQSSSLHYVATWSLWGVASGLGSSLCSCTEEPWQTFLLSQPLIEVKQGGPQRPCPKRLLTNNLLCDPASILCPPGVCGQPLPAEPSGGSRKSSPWWWALLTGSQALRSRDHILILAL